MKLNDLHLFGCQWLPFQIQHDRRTKIRTDFVLPVAGHRKHSNNWLEEDAKKISPGYSSSKIKGNYILDSQRQRRRRDVNAERREQPNDRDIFSEPAPRPHAMIGKPQSIS